MSRRRRGTILAACALGTLLLIVVVSLRGVLFPFLVAALIAYVLEPAVGRVERLGLPRIGSVLLVVLLFGGVAWGFGYSLLPKLSVEAQEGSVRIQAFLKNTPEIYRTIEGRVDDWLHPSLGALEDEAPSEDASEEAFGAGRAPLQPGSEGAVQDLEDVGMAPRSRDLWRKESLREAGARAHATRRTQAEIEEALDRAHLVVEEIEPGVFAIRLRESTFAIEGGAAGQFNITPQKERAPEDRFGNLRDELGRTVSQGVESTASALLSGVVRIVRSLFEGLFGALITMMLIFILTSFFLTGMPGTRLFMRKVVPTRLWSHYQELVSGLDEGLSGVIRGQLMICLVNGILSWIGYMIFIPEYAFAMAVFSGVMSLIPIFGTLISSFPVVLIALSTSLGTALGVAGWILGIHFIEANVLNPKIIGTAASIHPILVIFALIAGEHLYGLPGLLLAVPAVSVFQSLVQFAWRRIQPGLDEALS